MDPDKALEEIRSIIARINAEKDDSAIALLGEELAGCIQGLDEWLLRGGFLPESWKRIGAMGGAPS